MNLLIRKTQYEFKEIELELAAVVVVVKRNGEEEFNNGLVAFVQKYRKFCATESEKLVSSEADLERTSCYCLGY